MPHSSSETQGRQSWRGEVNRRSKPSATKVLKQIWPILENFCRGNFCPVYFVSGSPRHEPQFDLVTRYNDWLPSKIAIRERNTFTIPVSHICAIHHFSHLKTPRLSGNHIVFTRAYKKTANPINVTEVLIEV